MCIVQGVQCVLYKVCIVYCTRFALCIGHSADLQNLMVSLLSNLIEYNQMQKLALTCHSVPYSSPVSMSDFVLILSLLYCMLAIQWFCFGFGCAREKPENNSVKLAT